MALDKHGLQLTGIRSAAADTKLLNDDFYRGAKCEIWYDTESGAVKAFFPHDANPALGTRKREYWPKQTEVKIETLRSPRSMQELADMVYDYVRYGPSEDSDPWKYIY